MSKKVTISSLAIIVACLIAFFGVWLKGRGE